MKPVAFFFLIFLWLFHFQISKEGFSTQPTEASFHWGYKTSLILCSKTYISKMVTYSNAHQPSASNKMQRNVMSQLYSIELTSLQRLSNIESQRRKAGDFPSLCLNISCLLTIWGPVDILHKFYTNKVIKIRLNTLHGKQHLCSFPRAQSHSQGKEMAFW